MVEVEVAFDDVSDDFELRISWEWHLSREHDIEDNSERPNINLRVVVLKKDFRRDIVGLKIKNED